MRYRLEIAAFAIVLVSGLLTIAAPTHANERLATKEEALAFAKQMAAILPKKLNRLSLVSNKVSVQRIETSRGVVFVPIASQVYKAGSLSILHLAIAYPSRTALPQILRGRRFSRFRMIGMPLYIKSRRRYGRTVGSDPWARHALVAGDFVIFGKSMNVRSTKLIAHLHELDYKLLRKMQGGKPIIPKSVYPSIN